MSFRYTKHGRQRANQRGFSQYDIELIRRCATPVDDDHCEVYVLRNKDVEHEVSSLKRKIQRLEKMRGCKVVFADNQLITVHHTSRTHEKRLLRRVSAVI